MPVAQVRKRPAALKKPAAQRPQRHREAVRDESDPSLTLDLPPMDIMWQRGLVSSEEQYFKFAKAFRPLWTFSNRSKWSSPCNRLGPYWPRMVYNEILTLQEQQQFWAVHRWHHNAFVHPMAFII